MPLKYFSLEITENNKLTQVFRILLGIVCLIVAAFWIFYNIHLLDTDKILWVTIIFLLGFGLYQIWAAMGLAARFIEIGTGHVRLKSNAFLPATGLPGPQIVKIEIHPLNIIFYLSDKRINLRLGTTYYEINEQIIDAIIGFAGENNIPFEIIEEKISPED
jgi:hypothetical protein